MRSRSSLVVSGGRRRLVPRQGQQRPDKAGYGLAGSLRQQFLGQVKQYQILPPAQHAGRHRPEWPAATDSGGEITSGHGFRVTRVICGRGARH
jgi:hypothetical protein